MELSLVPVDQVEARPRRAYPSLEDIRRNTTNQYRKVAACVLSQEQRLLSSGCIRPEPTYDLSDPWFNDEHEGEEFTAGVPLALVGTGEPAAYLAPVEGTEDLHSVRHMGSGLVLQLPRDAFLTMPSRPPRMGEWAVAVGLRGAEARLNGHRGLCGPTGKPPLLEGCSESNDCWHWVTFYTPESDDDEPDDGAAVNDAFIPGPVPETVLLSLRNLAALPMPAPGAPAAPLDASAAPAFALPPLADDPLHAGEIITAQVETLALLASGGDGGEEKVSAEDAGEAFDADDDVVGEEEEVSGELVTEASDADDGVVGEEEVSGELVMEAVPTLDAASLGHDGAVACTPVVGTSSVSTARSSQSLSFERLVPPPKGVISVLDCDDPVEASAEDAATDGAAGVSARRDPDDERGEEAARRGKEQEGAREEDKVAAEEAEPAGQAQELAAEERELDMRSVASFQAIATEPIAIEEPAVEAVVVEVTAVEATTVEGSTVEAVAMEVTAGEATAIESSAVEAIAVGVPAGEAIVVEGSAVEAVAPDTAAMEAIVAEGSVLETAANQVLAMGDAAAKGPSIEAVSVEAAAEEAAASEDLAVEAVAEEFVAAEKPAVEDVDVQAAVVEASATEAVATAEEAGATEEPAVEDVAVQAVAVEASAMAAVATEEPVVEEAAVVEAGAMEVVAVEVTAAQVAEAVATGAVAVEVIARDATAALEPAVGATEHEASAGHQTGLADHESQAARAVGSRGQAQGRRPCCDGWIFIAQDDGHGKNRTLALWRPASVAATTSSRGPGSSSSRIPSSSSRSAPREDSPGAARRAVFGGLDDVEEGWGRPPKRRRAGSLVASVADLGHSNGMENSGSSRLVADQPVGLEPAVPIKAEKEACPDEQEHEHSPDSITPRKRHRITGKRSFRITVKTKLEFPS